MRQIAFSLLLGFLTSMSTAQNPDAAWRITADRIDPDNYFGITFPDGTTRENATYEGDNIKQADVNLLAYPLHIIQDEAVPAGPFGSGE